MTSIMSNNTPATSPPQIQIQQIQDSKIPTVNIIEQDTTSPPNTHSQQEPQDQQQPTQTQQDSRPPTTRTRSSSLLHRNLLTRLRPLPFQYVFSLYHTKPSTSSSPTLLADSIPDIATFYKIYNNFPWTDLPIKDGVHFFRSGVAPLWEDVENLRGGCWVLKVRREGGKAVRCWEELCLMVCGGELQSVVAKERDHILGISYSPRLYVSQISIWTKQGNNLRSIEALQKTVLSRLSEDLRPSSENEYYYKRHEEHDGWKGAVQDVTM